MFWDAAGKTVSSTAAFCDKEELGILGFGDSKMKSRKKCWNHRKEEKLKEQRNNECLSVRSPESNIRLDGLQYLSQEA